MIKKRFLAVTILVLMLFAQIASATVSSTTTPRKVYDGNDVTVSFPITFPFELSSDVVVLHTSATGVETTWTEDGAGDTGYAISSSTVTANTAPATGTTLLLYREMPLTQGVNLRQNRRLNAETEENVFDKLTLQNQDNNEKIGRALKFPITSDFADITLPEPLSQYSVRWKEDLSGMENFLVGTGSLSLPVLQLSDYDNLAAFVAAVGSTDIELWVDASETLSATVTTNANTTVRFINGFMFSDEAVGNADLNILGQVIAAPGQQIVSWGTGSGSVTLSGVAEAYIKWGGATGDGSTDDTANVAVIFAANKNIVVTDGTYVLTSITMQDNQLVRGISEETCILKHEDTTTENMLIFAASGSAFFERVQFDGNKDNNTISNDVTENHCVYGVSTVNFSFDHCIFRNTVRTGLRATMTGNGIVYKCRFYDGAEHGGGAALDTGFMNLLGAASGSATEVVVDGCRFENPAPSGDGLSPYGLQISGKLSSMTVVNNYFNYIGQVFGDSHSGCIDLYTWCDESIISNNKFFNREFIALKIQNSGNVTCIGNIVAFSSSANISYAALISLGVRPTNNEGRDTQQNLTFIGNILDGSSGDLMQIDATDPDASGVDGITVGWTNVIVDANIFLNPGDDTFRSVFCDGYFTYSNNIIRGVPVGSKCFDLTNISDFAAATKAGPIKIINNIMEGATGAHAVHLVAGAAHAGVDIDISGNSISGTDGTNYHVRIEASAGFDVSLLKLDNNTFRGPGRRLYAENVEVVHSTDNTDFGSGIQVLTTVGTYYESGNTWGEDITLRAGVYDFSVDGGVIGDFVLGSLPDNTVVTRAWYESITDPTSDGAATIAIGVVVNDVNGIITATAFDNAIFDPGWHDGTPNGAATNFTTQTTDVRSFVFTIGGADLTAGVFKVFWEYARGE